MRLFRRGAAGVIERHREEKTGGTTGLAGVKVRLVGPSDLSTVTETDGAFVLAGTAAAVKLRAGCEA